MPKIRVNKKTKNGFNIEKRDICAKTVNLLILVQRNR